jgi:hypothetical protein
MENVIAVMTNDGKVLLVVAPVPVRDEMNLGYYCFEDGNIITVPPKDIKDYWENSMNVLM